MQVLYGKNDKTLLILKNAYINEKIVHSGIGGLKIMKASLSP